MGKVKKIFKIISGFLWNIITSGFYIVLLAAIVPEFFNISLSDVLLIIIALNTHDIMRNGLS